MLRNHLLTTLLALGLPAWAAAQGAQERRLFEPSTRVAAHERLVPGALPVTPDAFALAALNEGDPVRVPLAANFELAGQIERVERRGARSFSLFGRFDDDPLGSFVVSVLPDAVAGVFEAPGLGLLYRLHAVDGATYQVTSVDTSTFASCGVDAVAAGRPSGPLAPQEAEAETRAPGTQTLGFCAVPAKTLDVIIAYTELAKNEAGGPGAIKAEAQLAVDRANQAYASSLVSARVRLLWTKRVTYQEAANIEDDLDALIDPSDNRMDALHDDRDDLGADAVCLFVGTTTSAGGYASCFPTEAGAFAIVRWIQAAPSWTFAHEIGHLQGCNHDLANQSPGCAAYADSYGWRYFGNSGDGWRTVMAYDNGPQDYTRIGRFSNPSVNFDGQPTGFVGLADNESTIDATASTCEAWRAPKFEVWVEEGAAMPWNGSFSDPWPTFLVGVGALFDGSQEALVVPELHLMAGDYDGVITLTQACSLHACGGSAILN